MAVSLKRAFRAFTYPDTAATRRVHGIPPLFKRLFLRNLSQAGTTHSRAAPPISCEDQAPVASPESQWRASSLRAAASTRPSETSTAKSRPTLYQSTEFSSPPSPRRQSAMLPSARAPHRTLRASLEAIRVPFQFP